ncbi:hypothetical protein EV201_2290 [Ancylomarina subtilis]|uniref:Ig-like domain-containing protein n=1 Tax=Ancylomarina subtilis TaxID=1639035 RepID=A0A4Q7VDY7_9BACT|nr:hypothetical protein EV201_2290 [Ancylomarina subtilis]
MFFFLTFVFIDVSGQSVIWSEDFSSYSGWTGIDGGVWPYYTNRNLGDYPAGVSKWSLDVSGCTLSDDNDFVQLLGDAKLNFQDVDGNAYWYTEAIPISNYTEVGISIDLAESGNLENQDLIVCHYRIDGGAWVRFSRKNNDFGTAKAIQTGLLGNTLEIRVRVVNNEGGEIHSIDNVIVSGKLKNTVILSSSSSSISEGGGSTTITATIASVQLVDVLINLGFSGSASGSDYSISNSQIIIPAGSLTASVTLSTVNDTDIEGDENLTVDISSVVNGVESGTQQVNIIIVDDDIPSTDPIQVDNKSPESGYTADLLVDNVLITGCLTADNIIFAGNEELGLGYFDAGSSDFPLKSGIIISTGEVEKAEGPNDGSNASENIGGVSGDYDVNLLTGNNAFDAQILEFDFVPAGDKLEFRYVFASEEYPEYACGNYNDVFGFIISGPGINGPYSNNGENIAIIPGTTDQEVSIKNINNGWCGNSTYYVDETGGFATRFDGRTTVLTAKADVQACETYHIRLIISDVADASYNSAVFLEAESFKTNEVVIKNGIGGSDDLEVMYEGCDNSFLKFTREDNLDQDFTFNITISGTAENGIDFVQTNASGDELGAFPNQITIPANETEVTYYYKAISDALIEGDEYFRLSFLKSCPCSSTPEYYTKDITIIDVPEIEATVPSNVQCMFGTPVATLTVEMKNLLDPANYEYNLDGGAYQNDNVFTINNPVVGSSHIVRVQDKFSCNPATDFTVIIPPVVPIESNAGPDKNICEGETVQLSGSGGIFYQWSCSPASGLAYLNNANVSNPTVDENIPFGVYTYTLTVKESASASAFCISTDEMILTVKENAHFTIGADKTEYCSGEQIQLSASVLNASQGDFYSWIPSTDVDTPNSANTTVTYSETSQSLKDFSLKVTKSNGCNHTENINGILIYPTPIVSLNASSIICTEGNSGQLNIDVTGGTPFGSSPFYTYSWAHDGTLTQPSATGLNAGNYSVTVSDSKSCSTTKNFDMNQTPKPIGIFFE